MLMVENSGDYNCNHSRISLDGEWSLAYCDIGQGNITDTDRMAAIPYQVPGDVHTALIEQGIIKEPLLDKNSEYCKWMEEKEYWCQKTFRMEASDIKTKSILTFEGLDCTADIWLNHVFLGRHSNSFVEISYDVSHLLQAGENTLLVRIDQGLYEVKDKDLRTMPQMWNNEQPYRSYMRKPQYVYGWDWTIWLPTCGIWRSVCIDSYEKAYIKDVYAHTFDTEVREGMSTVVEVDVEADILTQGNYSLECTIYGDVRYEPGLSAVATAGKSAVSCDNWLALTIENAKLWWCNGMGNPYLYRIVVQLKDEEGQVVHSLERTLGIRSIEIQEPILGNGESGFTFVLNGEPVFCKGANHVPADCLFGRISKEKNKSLIAMAKEAHMNMLRIWGGGIYESEDFMEACDKAGIMVWHDFMYACGYHPDYDETFMTNVKTEAIKAIKRLRNHTSLIGWSGNNEIQGMYYGQKRWIPDIVFYGESIYRKLLPELVDTYCRNVIYRESSPFGGEDPSDFAHGDQHVWELTHIFDHKYYLDLWRFTDFPLKFLSEFGIMGAMNVESAKKCISKEHLNPDDEVWLHHTNSCNDYKLLNMMVDYYFGEYRKYSLQQYILRSQVVQAEITRHIYDDFRCRKFVCSGLLFWTLSDSFGIHNWSLIDYYLQKKPIYYYLKRSMAPVAVAIRGYDVQNSDGRGDYKSYWENDPKPLELWVMNDTLEEHTVTLQYQVITLDGQILKSGDLEYTVNANSSDIACEVDISDIHFVPEDTILYVSLWESGEKIGENRYFFAPFSEMPCRDSEVTYHMTEISEDTYALELCADKFVWMLHLETMDDVVYSDNDFDLLPGVPRKIMVCTKDRNFVPRMHWIEG